MLMKPSSAKKKTSRAKARNAALLNLLGTPGLGSLIGRRWLAGTGQLLLSVAGFALVLVWFWKEMMSYYSQMSMDSPVSKPVPLALLKIGSGLFAFAWCWSLVTSISLSREASRVKLEEIKTFAAGQIKMTESNVVQALTRSPEWQRNGEIISRTFEFKDFPAAMKFVNDVAGLAEQAQHHPGH